MNDFKLNPDNYEKFKDVKCKFKSHAKYLTEDNYNKIIAFVKKARHSLTFVDTISNLAYAAKLELKSCKLKKYSFDNICIVHNCMETSDEDNVGLVIGGYVDVWTIDMWIECGINGKPISVHSIPI